MTEDKFQRFLAHTLRDDQTEKYADLLVWLNANGILTDTGRRYTTIRGVTSLITAAWRRATRRNDPPLAARIKRRYVDRDGRYTVYRARRRRVTAPPA